MWKSSSVDCSLEKVLSQEDVRSVLNRLCGLGHLATLQVFDETGRLRAAFPDDGPRNGSTGAAADPLPESLAAARTAQSIVREICFREQVMGRIVGYRAASAVPEQVERLLGLAADWVQEKMTSEYNNDSLSAEVLNNYEELNLLYEIAEEIVSVFDPHEVCDIVLRKALSVIGAEKASIFLWDAGRKKLRLMASAGLPENVAKDLTLEVNQGICGYVFRTGKPLLVEELKDLPRELARGAGAYNTESFLSVPMLLSPMKVKEKIIGLINLADNPAHRPYHAGDLKLLSAISSQAALSVHNSLLIEDLKENERFLKEMEIAETLQNNLLPRRAPAVPGVRLAGRCMPAKQVGGDYFDYFPCSDGRVGLVAADVSGHNISSGIMMAITRGLLKNEEIHTRSPGRVLAEVNRSLFSDLVSSELFITMAYFSYEPKSGSLSFANAGHNPPILLRAGREDAELLDAEGMGIGFLEDVVFEEKTFRLAPGDLLVLYTDGVVEAESGRGEPYGMERFLAQVRALRQQSCDEILDGIYRAVLSHLGGGGDPRNRQQDDITVVVLKVQPPYE